MSTYRLLTDEELTDKGYIKDGDDWYRNESYIATHQRLAYWEMQTIERDEDKREAFDRECDEVIAALVAAGYVFHEVGTVDKMDGNYAESDPEHGNAKWMVTGWTTES